MRLMRLQRMSEIRRTADTILVPASHLETLRPLTKNSSVEPVARGRYQSPIKKLIAKYPAMTKQSMKVRCTRTQSTVLLLKQEYHRFVHWLHPFPGLWTRSDGASVTG